MRHSVVLGTLLLLPSLLVAQQRRSWPVAVACDSAVTPRYATAMVSVFFDVPVRPEQQAPASSADVQAAVPPEPRWLVRQRQAADAVTRAFVLREPIVLPNDVVWRVPADSATPPGAQAPMPVPSSAEPPSAPAAGEAFWPLSGNVMLTFDSAAGTLRDIVIDSTTMAEPLRAALRTAVETAARAGSFEGLGPDSLRLFVRATSVVRPATAVLHRLPATYLPIEAAARVLSAVRPVYPKTLLQSDTEGYVDVAFTVLPTGRAADPTVLQATHPEFGTAVLTALGTARFAPARAGGCAVSAPVRQRIQFRLGT